MWTSTSILDELRRRGDLWEPVPGLLSLRGSLLELHERIGASIRSVATRDDFPEWRFAPGISLGTLARAQYFESFPQWLTAVGHLSDDPDQLEELARAPDPASATADAMQPPECALSPALCYHAYERFAGSIVDSARMAAQGTCWRHEGDRLRPLSRGWAFTMRELVHIGSPEDTERFRMRGIDWASTLATDLGLEHRVVPATDPFFAPTARGKALLQKVKGLKHELLLPIGGGEEIAAASFNNHEAFFGERFEIRRSTGEAAWSGCVAFGIERWTLAFLVAHGPNPDAWPELTSPMNTLARTSS